MPSTGVSTESFATATKAADTKGPKLKMAMIGCGGIVEAHLKALADFPDVQVVAAVDSNPARLEVMKEKYGITKLYSDWNQMLKEIKPMP